MPLAIDAAVPKISSLLAMRSSFYSSVTRWTRPALSRSRLCNGCGVAPAGSLIAGTSTRLPFGHALSRMQQRDTYTRSKHFDFALGPAFDRARDHAVAFDQEHRRDARDSVGVAGWEVCIFTIQ